MLAPAEIIAEAGGAADVPEDQVASTAALISELGFRSPVVVDARGRIVQGAARVLAAQRLGISAIPVRSLKESGAGSLALARATGRDPRLESLGVIGHTVRRPMVFARHELSWVACRGWRWSTKQADLAVFRAAKRDGAGAVIQAAAG